MQVEHNTDNILYVYKRFKIFSHVLRFNFSALFYIYDSG